MIYFNYFFDCSLSLNNSSRFSFRRDLNSLFSDFWTFLFLLSVANEEDVFVLLLEICGVGVDEVRPVGFGGDRRIFCPPLKFFGKLSLLLSSSFVISFTIFSIVWGVVFSSASSAAAVVSVASLTPKLL